MRTIVSLLILGLILGDGLIAFVVALKLFVSRNYSKTFLYLALLFAAIAVHLMLFLIAIGEMPRPRPPSFRWWVLAALSVLGLGVWPAALHFIGMAGKKKADSEPEQK